MYEGELEVRAGWFLQIHMRGGGLCMRGGGLCMMGGGLYMRGGGLCMRGGGLCKCYTTLFWVGVGHTHDPI